MNQLTFKAIEEMPSPLMDIPDYIALAKQFSKYIHDPVNKIIKVDNAGKTYFTSSTEGKGNELVTWGVIAVGEYFMLSERWKEYAQALDNYFNSEIEVYANAPGQTKTEYWYLFYVHTLAGAVYKSYFEKNEQARKRIMTAAYTLQNMAQGLAYDFNDQGYDFKLKKPWTNKDIFRQPDSIGGYAYNMLFAGIHGGDKSLVDEAAKAIELYGAFEDNPWYEIPNGSTALLAAAWLKSKGYDVNLERIAGFVFDPDRGPLQTGTWNGEAVDGLMMGWRGDDRESASSSAYSMETLMPLPFILPAVKYAPETAKSIVRYALNAVANFRLFFAEGKSAKIYETRPDLSNVVPYEKLEKVRDGHSPAACGDFLGHRSVYGGAYMPWIASIMRQTGAKNMPAWDIALTDMLDVNEHPDPMFLLHNNEKEEANASFSPCCVWKEKRPDLYQGEHINGSIYNYDTGKLICNVSSNRINITVPPKSEVIITLKSLQNCGL